jgi:hypothetical protein
VRSFMRRRLPAVVQPPPVASRGRRRMSRRPTAVVAAATAMIAALQGMGAATAHAAGPDDPPGGGFSISVCVLFCNGGSDVPDYTDHTTQNNQNVDPGPFVAKLNGGNVGPLELGFNLIQAIGVEETNPNGTEPLAVRSTLSPR